MFLGYKSTVFYICGTAALGGLLFGQDQGFIANSLDVIQNVYRLNTRGAAFTMIGDQFKHLVISLAPKIILLAAIILYIFGFAVSWVPVAWLVCSEIFPLQGRELGMTVTTIVNWTFAGLLMDNALTFMHIHGNASIFFIFSIFCILAIFFVAVFVPETRGVTFKQIEANLKSGKKMGSLGDVSR